LIRSADNPDGIKDRRFLAHIVLVPPVIVSPNFLMQEVDSLDHQPQASH